jgi:hypothetical protein
LKFNKIYLILSVTVLAAGVIGVETVSPWKENFNNINYKCNPALPVNWNLNITKFGVNTTSFYVEHNTELKKNVLVIDAKRASGGIVCNLSSKVDLSKTPILRWRWRVKALPAGADGRFPEKDDQPVAIYVGYSDWGKKKSVSYRWECETPRAESGNIRYGAGLVTIKWFCFRNQNDGVNKWYEEERNIAEDLRKTYGFVPKEFVITVCGNSQYTNSHTTAEIAYIEFAAEMKNVK